MGDPQIPARPTDTEEERRARLAWEAERIGEAERSFEEEGGIPFEEVAAWVESWGTLFSGPFAEERARRYADRLRTNTD